jgi:tRNA threonylcarbamoyladenosine biosynthesis protein TsaE|tara:strand:+ start:5991 stop:6449 length:459 start_codon:yes stop_codon:yes gene_type:complete
LDLILKNLDDTKELGEKLAQCCSKLQCPCVIYLIGDLGAGKTTLAQNFIKYFGFVRVKSPTYTLVETYQNENIDIHHFDCYRLTDPEELEYIGIREYLKPKSLQLIEWPELGKGALEKADISIKLSGNGETRKVKITFQTDLGKSIKECAVG